ncbi:MAG: response regulator transcription factor [Lachnospiraceae bacterium]|nr:response regulator transcription factor [Lachnospiraceae bacterium]
MRVAICDDEYKIQFLMEDYLEQIFREYDIRKEIEVYSNGEEFCRQFEKNRFDLVFLDIELPGMNGVQIGRFIREQVRDEKVQIAYVSGNTGYALELFEFRPINFLVKPVQLGDIRHVVDKYLLLEGQDAEVFRYKKGADFFQIPMSDILYFTSRGRKVTIYKNDGEDEFYSTMEQVYSQVKGKRFLFVHKSYIVNAKYIKLLEYERVTLQNKTVIPISQSKRSEIRKQFLDMKKEER